MKVKLGEIVRIQTGVFRKPVPNGDIIYLQAKDFNTSENRLSNEALNKDLQYDASLKKHILQKNDILFASKGFRNFAVQYDSSIGQAVASSTFFVFRIHDIDNVLPEYLVCFLNTGQTLRFLKANAIGTNLPSISKQVLGNLAVQLPDISIQKKISKFNALRVKEKKLSKQLQEKKEILYNQFLHKLAYEELK